MPLVSLTPVANLPPVSTAQGGTFGELVAKFATGVVDTCGKFAAGFVDTGGTFSAGVVDTGGISPFRSAQDRYVAASFKGWRCCLAIMTSAIRTPFFLRNTWYFLVLAAKY